MGCLYANCFSAAGIRVVACDLPSQMPGLREKYKENKLVELRDEGTLVVREADIIIYSVEAANIEKVVKQYGPSTKVGATVIGQSSVKQTEVDAFLKYLPSDVSILPCHSLHGPAVATPGQTMVLIQTRCTDALASSMTDLFVSVFGYKVVIMTSEEHDTITANTQVLTHLGFLSMGSAWKSMGCYPWESQSYVGGIDNVKVLACLRIYASKAHIYCGLAMLNPRAKEQVLQYYKSTADLFKLMITEKRDELYQRLTAARDAVFDISRSKSLLPDDLLQEYSLGTKPEGSKPNNSHLSILAMVDSWHKLGIKPYQHLVCETPVFRLRLGIAEYLFTDEKMLTESIDTACYDKSIRADDFEFTAAVREWTTVITHGDTTGYCEQFEQTSSYFSDRLADGLKMSTKLIERLAKS
eukprot:TRINITY_DN15591_c0_g1_i1.p1 TRINITY_DN15591_c0_g1~~TRINITY_DN15591_c0_g1_i1.p1  ORF type:complete len:442 (+),score=132.60 TRINITY_DN15591_c0_g1_i1:93-1328(+)